jgi:hypothetical protein
MAAGKLGFIGGAQPIFVFFLKSTKKRRHFLYANNSVWTRNFLEFFLWKKFQINKEGF